MAVTHKRLERAQVEAGDDIVILLSSTARGQGPLSEVLAEIVALLLGSWND